MPPVVSKAGASISRANAWAAGGGSPVPSRAFTRAIYFEETPSPILCCRSFCDALSRKGRGQNFHQPRLWLESLSRKGLSMAMVQRLAGAAELVELHALARDQAGRARHPTDAT